MDVLGGLRSFFSRFLPSGKHVKHKQTQDELVAQLDRQLEAFEAQLASANPRTLAENLYIDIHPMLRELFHVRYQFTFEELADGELLAKKTGRKNVLNWKKILESLTELEYAPRTVTRAELASLLRGIRSLLHSIHE
jgi:hypothetical protein